MAGWPVGHDDKVIALGHSTQCDWVDYLVDNLTYVQSPIVLNTVAPEAHKAQNRKLPVLWLPNWLRQAQSSSVSAFKPTEDLLKSLKETELQMKACKSEMTVVDPLDSRQIFVKILWQVRCPKSQ